jgi:phosphoglycolate phosphatase
MLVLFDCDGTLFLADDPLATEAMVEALGRMTGATLTTCEFEQLDHEARTARWMVSEVIKRRGLPQVDLTSWAALVERIYHERLPTHTDWHAPIGAAATLEALQSDGFTLALLTGVPKKIARTRMQRLGVARFLPEEQGAYGSEVEERSDLVNLALQRAGVAAGDAIHVGDTSRDVCCSREIGGHAIATAFDGCRAAAAADAAAIVETMPELRRAVLEIVRG